jgi:hypothetical protein
MKTKYLLLLSLLFTGYCATAQVKNEKARENKGAKIEATAKTADLEAYKGHYASDENRDGIVIYIQDNKLYGKLPGQPSIAFDHTGNNTFKSGKAGIIITFNKDKKQLALQRKEGTVYLFKK